MDNTFPTRRHQRLRKPSANHPVFDTHFVAMTTVFELAGEFTDDAQAGDDRQAYPL
jgi:hypothetical protein